MVTTDLNLLLRHLPAVDQKHYKPRTCPFGWDQPKFYWIFKNIDFNKWQVAANDSEVLWLSGPAKCRISDASSHIVDLAKEKYLEAQHSVLYFFCSTAPRKTPIAKAFVSTIVCQLICCTPELKQEITTIFLRALYDAILEEPLSKAGAHRFYADDSAEVTVKLFLEASSDAYWRALMAVTGNGCQWEKGLSLIIDGLDKVEDQKYDFIQKLLAFTEHLQERPFTTRVLLTSRPQAEIKEILGKLPSIEYDKERKGLVHLFSYSQLEDKRGS